MAGGSKRLLDESISDLTDGSGPLKRLQTRNAASFRNSGDTFQVAQAHTTRFDGTGISHSGSGQFQVNGNLSIGLSEHSRCLADLRTTDPRHDKTRIELAKGGLLEDSYHWVLDNHDFRQWRDNAERPLLWVKGDPGKGKTMLLCGIIDELAKHNGVTLAYFFCQSTDVRLNTATAVLRGLIYLLIDRHESLISYILKKYEHAGKALFQDVNAWFALAEILTGILHDPLLSDTYIIIDALDECETDRDLLVDLILRSCSSARVKWIVSSRNWQDIEKKLNASQNIRLSLELNETSVADAVRKYIQHKVTELSQAQQYNTKIRNAVEHHLVSNADNTFLWVALVCQELAKIPAWRACQKLAVFPSGLNSLYRRMINQIHKSDEGEICKQILALLTITYRPITIDELRRLTSLPDDLPEDDKYLEEIIGMCGSFLIFRTCTVSFLHQSAKDFLQNEAADEIFPAGISQKHYDICSRSIQTMSSILKRDIYSICHPGLPINDFQSPYPDPLSAASYACVYWIDHLCDCISGRQLDTDLQDGGIVDTFLRHYYIYWLEALGLLRSVPKGVLSLSKLLGLIQVKESKTHLAELVKDASRFIQYHRACIEEYPLQVYASGLIFSPAQSIVRKLFQHEEPDWIIEKPIMEDNWSPCIQTLEGHSDAVKSIAFSPNGGRLASCSNDRNVKLWDANTGACLKTLEGHTGYATSVAFSPDGGHLASGSHDHTAKLWNADTGVCLQTLRGHNGYITSIAFSPRGGHLASGSFDHTAKLWNTNTGACWQTLGGHIGAIQSVAFSPDGHRLACGSYGTIKLWDPDTGTCLLTLASDRIYFNAVAFSPDGSRLASIEEQAVKLWDISTGACLQILANHGLNNNCVTFSPDGGCLASTEGKTVKLWDTNTGVCLQALVGHIVDVTSVAFSPDGGRIASCSDDRTIKLWDANSGACLQPLVPHDDAATSIDFSYDNCQYDEVFVSNVSDMESQLYVLTNSWITWSGEKVLWLPPEFRSSRSASTLRSIAIECVSERVLLFQFSADIHPIVFAS